MSINVQYGVDDMQVSTLDGKTIGYAREKLGPVFNLRGNEQAEVNRDGCCWEVQNDNFVLRDGDELRFSADAGEKGYRL